MKMILALSACLLLRLTAFSQGLKPLNYKINNVDMHCFTTPQAKHIAGKLINGQLRDTILIDLSDVNDSLSYATKIQKQVITRNESAMSTYRNENYLRNEEAVACEKQKQLEIKTQKKDKLKKIVVAVLVGFVAGVLVEKH